jgi:tetratricopeptide (TPR) repeat protein
MIKLVTFLIPILLANILMSRGDAETGATTSASDIVYSQNSEANALFLKARELMKIGDPHTGGKLSNVRRAIKLFEQAVKKDSKFALAYVELARAWLSLGYSDPDGVPDSITVPHARAAVRQAIEIDPKLAEAHQLLAAISYNLDYDWETADREYRIARELALNSAGLHTSYAAYLSSMGRFSEALTEEAKADAIAPSLTNDVIIGRTYYSMRQWEKAEVYCKKSLAKKDNVLGRVYLGFTYIAEGRYDNALLELEAAQHFSKNAGAAASLAYGYAMAGQADRARELLAKLFSGHDYGTPVAYRMAAVYLALGDKDKAIEWLLKSYTERENWMNQLKVDPVMDPLRSDPRFAALMKTMKFA